MANQTAPKKKKDEKKKYSGPKRFIARRGGKEYGGMPLDRGQVFTLKGLANDERLVRLGFIAPFKGGQPVECSDCGLPFATPADLANHGEIRHQVRRAMTPVCEPQQPGESDLDFERRKDEFARQVLASEDEADAKAERREERDAPLDWDNTEASRKEADL
jgi:hypothetical protein